MQKPMLGDPTSALDQFLMHDSDLTRRSTETDEAELQPVTKRLGERHG
jgi:hypothetical protein